MKKLVLVLFLMTVAVAAPAQAKELLGAQLCGPDGCVTQRAALAEGPNGPFSGELAPAAKPGSWYRGYLLAGDHGKVIGKMLFYYVPGSNQVVQPGRLGQTTTWTHPDAKLASLVAALAQRTPPFAAPTFTNVTLNEKSVDDPSSYGRLWTLATPAEGYPDEISSQQVVFYSESPSPWSDGNYVVAYAKSNLLLRDGQLVTMPKDMAARVTHGASLDTGRSLPWTLIAAALAVLVLAASIARRLRPRAAPQPAVQA